MPRFFPLTITHIEKNTPNSAVISLSPRKDDRAKFSYRAGQYLNLRHLLGGEECRRSYSIASGEGGTLKIGVKEVEGGAFSRFANRELKSGDVLEAMPPEGRFTLPDAPLAKVLMIAAGSGITPIISHIETLLARDNQAQISLIYANRDGASTMFRERLEELKNRFMGRLSIIHIHSRAPQEIGLFGGRLSANKLVEIAAHWPQFRALENVDAVMICGPEELTRELSRGLEEMGVAKERIKYELFNTGREGPGRAASPNGALRGRNASGQGKSTRATIILDGASHSLDMEDGQSLLEAARAHQLDAPFSCQSGICSTCRCKIIDGEGEMRVNHALEDYEVRAGFALSCQLVPSSEAITISYDEGH